jgi:hypothetical protein
MSSMEKRGSFYKKTEDSGSIEYDYLKTRINSINLTTVDTIRITSIYENRPDLISLKYYGSYNYGWLVSMHNEILNPFEDYHIGRVIKIPSLEDYYRFYNRNKFK